MNVIIECVSCAGSIVPNCSSCGGNGYLEARLWTQGDQKRRVKAALRSEAERRDAAKLEESRSRLDPKTHWRLTPYPASGWVLRCSAKHGEIPFHGNVRVVDSAEEGNRPRYRVEVIDRNARKWLPHRARSESGVARIVYTRILERAFALAEGLYVPTEEEAVKVAEKAALRAWVDGNSEPLRKLPHPSKYHAEKTL